MHQRGIGLKAISFAIVGLVNSTIDFGIFSYAYYNLEFSIVSANVFGMERCGHRLLCNECDDYVCA